MYRRCDMVAAAEMLKLDPQEKLDFSKPQEWPEWRFRSVTKLNAEDEILPINALIYTMGKEADYTLKGTGLRYCVCVSSDNS